MPLEKKNMIASQGKVSFITVVSGPGAMTHQQTIKLAFKLAI